MAGFIRGFSFDPGEDVLLEIESINILDLDPPPSIQGVGTGVVTIVAEFEDGPYTPRAVSGAPDLATTFGEFGYRYNGVVGNNPCARARYADSAVIPEYWNGNGFIQLSGKRFKSLIVQRVDTTIGEVSFYRQAYVTGLAAFSYNLEPGQVLSLDIGAGRTSATFTATAAVYTSTAGTFPTTFAGGEYIDFQYDDSSTIRVSFLAADQTQVQAIARINATFGFTFASDAGTGTTAFTSRRRGKAAKVQIIGASAPGVLTQLGMAVTTVAGGGNVNDIDAVRFAEIKTIVEAGVSGTIVEQDSSGRLRVSKVAASPVASDYIFVGEGTTALALGLNPGQEGSADGIARIRSTAQTFPTTMVDGSTLTLGIDGAANVTCTFATASSQVTVMGIINAALGFTAATTVSSTVMKLQGLLNGGSIRIVGASLPLVLTNLGLTLETIQPPAILAVQIPAGTVVTNSGATVSLVTAQTITTTTASSGPFKARVRHALDDGTGTSALAGAIVKVPSPPDNGSFGVVNEANVTVALTESQIDAQYSLAFDKTLASSGPTTKCNIIYSARQSNVIRRKIRDNAIQSRNQGLFGRIGIMRTPMNLDKATAMSTNAEPGMGAYRSQRVIFNYPQASTTVPQMGLRGTGGGAGFTFDGTIDVGADGFAATLLSQLPPEENPGQATTFLDGVVGLESGANVQNFVESDYTAFKAAGIMALRMDEDTGPCMQSGVVNVDPIIYPNLKNVARRRMADYCQDTLSVAMKPFSKRLNKLQMRKAAETEARTFYELLLSREQPSAQRIAGYTLDIKSRNTKASLAKGLFYILNVCKTLSSMDSIVLQFSVGESVVVTEELTETAQAA